jgi:DNA-binding response OmpR family regulator
MTDDSLPIVVVVDDSPSIKALFERGTEELDVELKIFGSANSSWEFLGDNRPELIFLNIKMPGKDGLTFLQEIRELPLHKDTPVVMITSKDYAQDRSIASQLGAAEFITKPMPIRVITEAIVKYIKQD